MEHQLPPDRAEIARQAREKIKEHITGIAGRIIMKAAEPISGTEQKEA